MTLVPDYSYVSAHAQCLRKGYWSYQHAGTGLEKRERPAYLHAGSALHEALHAYYTTAGSREAAEAALKSAWGTYAPVGELAWLTRGHCEVVLANYMDAHPHDEFELLVDAAPETAMVEDWDGLLIGGKPDFPTRKAGGTYALDFKCTMSDVTTWWASKYALSHQLRTYMWLLGQRTGLRFDGAYIMGIHIGKHAQDQESAWKKRTSAPSALFGPFMFSPALVAETRAWYEGWLRIIDACEASGNWPQNEGQQCARCDFRELCTAHPLARTSLASATFQPRECTGVLASGADSSLEEAA